MNTSTIWPETDSNGGGNDFPQKLKYGEGGTCAIIMQMREEQQQRDSLPQHLSMVLLVLIELVVHSDTVKRTVIPIRHILHIEHVKTQSNSLSLNRQRFLKIADPSKIFGIYRRNTHEIEAIHVRHVHVREIGTGQLTLLHAGRIIRADGEHSAATDLNQFVAEQEALVARGSAGAFWI